MYRLWETRVTLLGSIHAKSPTGNSEIYVHGGRTRNTVDTQLQAILGRGENGTIHNLW